MKRKQTVKDNVTQYLKDHLANVTYWVAAYTVDDFNSVTNGPVFNDEKQIEDYCRAISQAIDEFEKAEVNI